MSPPRNGTSLTGTTAPDDLIHWNKAIGGSDCSRCRSRVSTVCYYREFRHYARSLSNYVPTELDGLRRAESLYDDFEECLPSFVLDIELADSMFIYRDPSTRLLT